MTKIAERDTVYYHDPCPDLFRTAVEQQQLEDAKLLIRAYVEHGLPKAQPNPIILSELGAKAIDTALATNDDGLFGLVQASMRHKEGPRFDFLFNTARYHAVKGDKPRMLAAMMEVLERFGVKPSTFTKEPVFAPYKKDPDFVLATKGKYVAPTDGAKAATTAEAVAKQAVPKGMVSWTTRPKAKVVHDAIKAFFDALAKGKLDAARPMLAHDEGFDENVSSLYRHLQIGEDSLAAKPWNADLGWLAHVTIGKLATDDGEPFDAEENPACFVPISYKKRSTDITADFALREAGDTYFLACTIIHIM